MNKEGRGTRRRRRRTRKKRKMKRTDKNRSREEHSMDQYRSRPKLSENFEGHWSIPFPGEIHMDQSLVHTFSWGNSYGPMVLKVLQKFPPTLVLVHGWLFPEKGQKHLQKRCADRRTETLRKGHTCGWCRFIFSSCFGWVGLKSQKKNSVFRTTPEELGVKLLCLNCETKTLPT